MLICAGLSCGKSRLLTFLPFPDAAIADHPGTDSSPDKAAVDAPGPDGAPDLPPGPDVPIITVCPAAKLIGYATLGGTPAAPATTGGDGGAVIQVTTLADLTTAAGQIDKLVIRVSGTITLTDQVKVKSNKTIEGVLPGDGLLGGGLNLVDSSNIIIRNLTIAKALATDAISLNNSKNVWIDHCDLSSSLDQPEGTYDGLVDITHGSDWVTVSWNKFHDHYNTSLVGGSNSLAVIAEDTSHLNVTYHHNWFFHSLNYNPRVRVGSVHVFDNLYEYDPAAPGTGNAIVSQTGAQVLVEANTFMNVPTPIRTTYEDPIDGSAWLTSNTNVCKGTCGDNIITISKFWTPPYDYSGNIEPAATGEALVRACAGPSH